MTVTASVCAALALATSLGGCAPEVLAPTNTGVCWSMTQGKDRKIQFYKLAANQPDLEHCGAALERMRVHFLSLGGTQYEVDGAYQGQFIFDDPRGVFTSTSLTTTPYLALVHTSDGHLVIPGAAPPS